MPSKPADSKPFPLSDTLHDLAVLRASDIDLAAYLRPNASGQGMKAKPDAGPALPDGDGLSLEDSEREQLVAKSFDYVREGRAAIRLLHRGDADKQGARADKIRGELEDILSGLDAEDSHR